MKKLTFNILAIGFFVLLLAACKKDESRREMLTEGRITFDLPTSSDVVQQNLDIKEVSLLSMEMKAALLGGTSADPHYVTFAPDTTKIAAYREKYGSAALLLPSLNYLFYKSTVAINAGSNVSESAVLNLSFQNLLRPQSTYVLPLAITAVDGIIQDPGTRKVVYYVFNTGDALYVDHAGLTVTATASSTAGANTASRAIDPNTGTTYWASATSGVFPQSLNIDYAREVSFSGVDIFYPTSVNINYATLGGDPTSVKVETSVDNSTWIDQGTYSVDIRNTARKHTMNLPSQTTARYVRVTVLDAAPYVSGTLTFSVVLVSGIMLRN
ncbi:DUF1735 domain-containing protein [Sphingobacterium alkalisoli]|uniref:DUF1735 domain-containing protein n=1 Tax=Sphingobacterium alkalisoli TaxID=1874115 RepID=A0A4U0GNY0_9SPHI|nr:discoidin domain-containing protein [Sphingobacterium alkalisoli]TJY60084.1 DUF1735 domain-containing protein [Sphingobacterium alkalisoli]GGH32785.1 hypothetical protein GCM10011418_46550 [Sphingobacterium alkalisoli]